MMTFSRKTNIKGRERESFARRAFTLIEIMIVVAIMGVILAVSAPSFTRMFHKEGMRKAVSDMLDACTEARRQAILTGTTVDLVLHPVDASFEVTDAFPSVKLPDNIAIETLGVNFVELREADEARVHFYANGTSDEFTIVLRSDESEVRMITLELVTGLADVEVVR
jgi:prepilin-type N-terminal cleavage/methylation domain-containing protein